MYFLRARYYDPELGRFISRDPVRGSLTVSQSQNPYIYALNNPINLSDPSGELPRTGIKPLDLILMTGEYAASTSIGQRCIQLAQRAYGALSKPSVTNLETKAPNIIIKSEQHAARHLEGTNLTVEAVEKAIRSDILSKGINETSKLKDVTINVNGTNLIYRPYVLEDGTISVGTYFVPK